MTVQDTDRRNADAYSMLPVALALSLLLLDGVVFYSGWGIFVWLTAFACILGYTFGALTALFRKRFKSSLSRLSGAALLGVMLLTPLRASQIYARHYVEFMLGEKQYEAEIAALPIKANTYKYRSWQWQNDAMVGSTDLVYDESDKYVYHRSPGTLVVTVRILKGHFYLVTTS